MVKPAGIDNPIMAILTSPVLERLESSVYVRTQILTILLILKLLMYLRNNFQMMQVAFEYYITSHAFESLVVQYMTTVGMTSILYHSVDLTKSLKTWHIDRTHSLTTRLLLFRVSRIHV